MLPCITSGAMDPILVVVRRNQSDPIEHPSWITHLLVHRWAGVGILKLLKRRCGAMLRDHRHLHGLFVSPKECVLGDWGRFGILPLHRSISCTQVGVIHSSLDRHEPPVGVRIITHNIAEGTLVLAALEFTWLWMIMTMSIHTTSMHEWMVLWTYHVAGAILLGALLDLSPLWGVKVHLCIIIQVIQWLFILLECLSDFDLFLSFVFQHLSPKGFFLRSKVSAGVIRVFVHTEIGLGLLHLPLGQSILLAPGWWIDQVLWRHVWATTCWLTEERFTVGMDVHELWEFPLLWHRWQVLGDIYTMLIAVISILCLPRSYVNRHRWSTWRWPAFLRSLMHRHYLEWLSSITCKLCSRKLMSIIKYALIKYLHMRLLLIAPIKSVGRFSALSKGTMGFSIEEEVPKLVQLIVVKVLLKFLVMLVVLSSKWIIKLLSIIRCFTSWYRLLEIAAGLRIWQSIILSYLSLLRIRRLIIIKSLKEFENKLFIIANLRFWE